MPPVGGGAGGTLTPTTTPTMRRLLPALLLLALADAVTAQTVTGRIYDVAEAGTDEAPVIGAAVRLLAGADTVAVTTTGADGRYRLRAPREGRYRLAVTSLGYGPAEGGPFALAEGRARAVDVQMVPAVGFLGSVAVEAEEDRLGRVGYYERRARALGRYVDREEIERRQPRVLSDLFYRLPGFIPLPQEGDVRIASVNSIRGASCRPTIVVDGAVVRSFGEGGGGSGLLSANPAFALDEIVRVDEVEAVEAYAHGGIPAQYGGTMSPCGLIVVWTRAYADPGDSIRR